MDNNVLTVGRPSSQLPLMFIKPEIGIRTVRTGQAAPRRITAVNLRFDPCYWAAVFCCIVPTRA
jgi:hypothetical protein